VLTKIHIYTRDNFTDYTLWEVFSEDFEKFDIKDFKIIRSGTKAKLRLLLVSRGVFVGKRSPKLAIYQALHNTVHKEVQHKWTDEELTEALTEIGEPIVTRALRKRLNKDRTELRGEEDQSEVQS
jgi:nicotinate-nucleotide pyrophosphorylase